ncbi:SGNH/GDSL hydrolase family protein [Paludisphaera rhizosphaerae]|uniref:SGNH/GDSL hydrolase family protein n=1 Tax=Paludisphaera rhizosphaerae TaxID=2711216 RepID=UPI0013EDE135|nr:GDSL-type esterase/lipase family protein [Paludisphaera rhizosphaerae]
MPSAWLIHHVASGQAFFTGAACLIAAAWLSTRAKRTPLRATRNALVGSGTILVVASATPLPVWTYVILFVWTASWAVGEWHVGKLSARTVGALRLGVAAVWLAAVMLEATYHVIPALPRLDRPMLGVVGDSLTAGTGDAHVVGWPTILGREHGIDVRTHARAGAGVAEAIGLAREITPAENLVLLEIGGNDMLGGTPVARFEEGLDRLLAEVVRPGRVVVMMELPLPPTFNAFGRSQRRLARRYGVHLIPKRVLLGVLLRQGTTSDSVHLTEAGANAMADAVWRMLGPAFTSD